MPRLQFGIIKPLKPTARLLRLGSLGLARMKSEPLEPHWRFGDWSCKWIWMFILFIGCREYTRQSLLGQKCVFFVLIYDCILEKIKFKMPPWATNLLRTFCSVTWAPKLRPLDLRRPTCCLKFSAIPSCDICEPSNGIEAQVACSSEQVYGWRIMAGMDGCGKKDSVIAASNFEWHLIGAAGRHLGEKMTRSSSGLRSPWADVLKITT